MPALPSHRPLIMGILNVTPDSFSGDGLWRQKGPEEAIIQCAIQMAADGADILDIGGESTRPGATPVSAEEESRRVIPALKAVHARLPEMPLSIDTTKPDVAKEALAAGATIINDISGAAQTPEMRSLAAQSGAYLVLMHNAATAQAISATPIVGGEYVPPAYENVVEDVVEGLSCFAALAEEVGVAREKIILDPGIGFGKTPGQNMRLIKELGQIVALGFPVLLAPSRKSFIGRVLDLPPGDRLEGTAAAVAIGVLNGASILRVHDVKAMARTVRMATAIRES